MQTSKLRTEVLAPRPEELADLVIRVSATAEHGAALNHAATVVRPALRQYLAAERSLTDALASKDADAIATAREDVINTEPPGQSMVIAMAVSV